MRTCALCHDVDGIHEPGCPVAMAGEVATLILECTCGQMPHRDDCMVKTGKRPAKTPDVEIDVDGCGCLAMLRGEVNAWLAEAAMVEGRTKEAFLGHAQYLMGLIERAEARHALQQSLTPTENHNG